MKAIDGQLDITKRYKIATIHCDYKGSSGTDKQICENCGKLLSNWAVLDDNDGKSYIVGLDCAEVISSLSDKSLSWLEVKEAKKRNAREIRFLKYLHTKCQSIIFWDNCANCMDNNTGDFTPRKLSYKCSYRKYKTIIDGLIKSGKITAYYDSK